ncbi:APC family permease [Clostridium algidicarnis]|uniref:Amino acid permease n=1 Tax=Clostridium algidicarnis TaxID=37659 RepID=A0ABS6C0N7_9CLOT|nr:amino acid permease [Clostridium algidicarnis]MBB6630033.1 amino acid permease [Clostridium algidicarnis]MBU3193312.1 amino acid permease [Clostridium algidicarnis]MBU3196993.1 amino acid permease [Clostridium algidicarnis]MBU3219055.1 amino acid permease [Clostridium algidicarnis]MCB2286258.1 amino acid permease [Clostridium algidicarnis]
MEKSNNNNLKKSLGLFDAMAIVIGMVIGSGIFFKPAIVFKNAGSPILAIMAWIVGGIIALASALTVAEIASAIPKTGGLFIYLKTLYGEKWAFLFGWVQTLVYVPGSIAALSIVLATQVTAFIPITSQQQKLVAIGFLLFLALLNVMSTKLGSKIQGIITVAKLLPILVIILLGFIRGTSQGIIINNFSGGTVTGFGAAVLGTLWAYDGWMSVTNMAGELKNPKKDLPKSIILGLLVTIVIYVLINIALVKIIPVEAIISSNKPASDAAIVLFGGLGAKFISAGILLSILGALNGYIMTGVRVPFAMAEEKLLPFSKFFGKVNDKFGTPANAFMFEMFLACLYVLSGSFDMLTDLVMFVLWIFFTMAVAGIFLLRKNFKDLERTYTVPLYPFIPLIGIVGSTYIIISTMITNSAYALYGTIITLLGLPVYFYIKKHN